MQYKSEVIVYFKNKKVDETIFTIKRSLNYDLDYRILENDKVLDHIVENYPDYRSLGRDVNGEKNLLILKKDHNKLTVFKYFANSSEVNGGALIMKKEW